MAGGGGPEFGGGGRKNLSADVNLVPFIDLLSVCICFLLMTAVWVQIGSVEVKQTFGTSSSVPTDSYELEFRFASPQAAEIVVKKAGKSERPLAIKGTSPETMRAAVGQKLDELVLKRGVPGAAILNPHRDVTHGDLVAMMDLLRKHKVSSLGIAAVGM